MRLTGSSRRFATRFSAGLAVALILSSTALARTIPVARDAWIATWAASPQGGDLSVSPTDPFRRIDGQTVRERVRVSIGGRAIRVQLSNAFGSTPVEIGAATVALAEDAQSIRPATLRDLTFAGQPAAVIPAGGTLLSDPVKLAMPDEAELSVSLYLPHPVAAPSVHNLALRNAVITPPGNFTHEVRVYPQETAASWLLISAVLVRRRPQDQLVAAFGNSITDGERSTLEADRNWASDLSRRLSPSRPGSPRVAVVNEGISGNQLLGDGYGQSALARFDRDVLELPGLTHVVVMEGINDIGVAGANVRGHVLIPGATERSAQDVIGAYEQLIRRAHARGVTVIGATLTPFEGVAVDSFYSVEREATCQAVNGWTRSSGAFDAVVDFNSILRDPEHPARLLARFASVDRLHPNDLGYQAMADAVDATVLNQRFSPRNH